MGCAAPLNRKSRAHDRSRRPHHHRFRPGPWQHHHRWHPRWPWWQPGPVPSGSEPPEPVDCQWPCHHRSQLGCHDPQPGPCWFSDGRCEPWRQRLPCWRWPHRCLPSGRWFGHPCGPSRLRSYPPAPSSADAPGSLNPGTLAGPSLMAHACVCETTEEPLVSWRQRPGALSCTRRCARPCRPRQASLR